jgi:hypothetical protein
MLQAFEFVIAADLAGTQTPRVDTGLRREHTVGKLLTRHLEREEPDRRLVTDCSLPRDVECERRLTDGGASREEDEIRFLETREDVVECRESGGDTAHPALMLLEMFKTLKIVKLSREIKTPISKIRRRLCVDL